MSPVLATELPQWAPQQGLCLYAPATSETQPLSWDRGMAEQEPPCISQAPSPDPWPAILAHEFIFDPMLKALECETLAPKGPIQALSGAVASMHPGHIRNELDHMIMGFGDATFQHIGPAGLQCQSVYQAKAQAANPNHHLFWDAVAWRCSTTDLEFCSAAGFTKATDCNTLQP